MTAKRLILENKMGQQVRSFHVEDETSNLIYRYDTRRIEMHTDLNALKDEGVEFKVLKKVSVSSLEKRAASLAGLGTLRIVSADAKPVTSPTYELPPDEDKEKVVLLFRKTAIIHGVAVAVLVAFSFAFKYFTQKEEPQLVTITLPEKKEPEVRNKVQRVKVSETKIKPPKNTKIKKIAEKNVIKPVTPKAKINRKAPTPVVRKKQMVVRNKTTENVNNVGALAALGGLKNGTRGYEGLDANSLKNIRSAGTGSGGGGVGSAGAGGVRGVMPGTGLIAGSTGNGGRAEGAGGYGTKGQGGGRAGYGKISLVGSTSGISLPIDEEASIQGGLDRDQIAAVINRRKGEIIYCYEQGLQNNAGLRGRVTVDFVINGSGRVSMARVAQSSLASRSVESCMIAKLKNWQFPRPVGNVNVDVTYPFELRRVTSR